jgi:hypothetical protein
MLFAGTGTARVERRSSVRIGRERKEWTEP